MSTAIHKHRLEFPVREEMILMTFKDAKILHVNVDPKGIPSIWLLVDKDKERGSRKIRIVPTGAVDMPLTALGEHIGTIIVEDEFWHFFDLGNA